MSKQLKTKVWELCSKAVRYTECWSMTGDIQYGKCITCGKTFPFAKLQAGHFVPGRSGENLFDTRGIHPQCMPCNMIRGGMPAEYNRFMRDLYPQDIVNLFYDRKGRPYKWTKSSLEELQVEFKSWIVLCKAGHEIDAWKARKAFEESL